MQSSRKVFFYPISFTPRFHPNSPSHFSITLKSFRRDIYRPITGKERLFSQTSLDPPLQLKFQIPSQHLSSLETCRQHLSSSLVLPKIEPRIREILAFYAIQLIGESGGRAFELKADAEDVELHLMDESQGWTICDYNRPTKSVPVHECCICLEELLCEEEGEGAIELNDCCHVFHKLCLWRWTFTNSSCPLCRLAIFKRPKF